MFPPKDIKPVITELRLNNKVICSGKDVRFSNVTRITITHSINAILKPGSGPSQLPNRNEGPATTQRPIQPISHSTTTTTTTQAPAISSSTPSLLQRFFPNKGDPLVIELNETCGKRGPTFGARIVNGEFTNPGDWPWIVAIFISEQTKKTSSAFTCGGTLITAKTVVTAAHCIKLKNNKQFTGEEITVVAGVHNLHSANEGVSVARTVSKVHVHLDFNEQLTNFDADIALLIVRDRFVLVF